ncbi:MAG TPA: hypothetical protein VH619_08025 [Verrucomicrobiae bacterium]|jgi:chromosome segregation ATPase|nr:hypothetical protein [Verrucomicrobiae bacterium]
MKNLQQNILIFLALALCGLCAWQWYFQTVQRNRIDVLDTTVFKQDGEIQSFTNSIASMEAEISGQQSRITELKQTVMSNNQAIVERDRENLRLQIAADALTNEIVQYQAVTNILSAKLKEVYDGVQKQNTAVTNLVAQRDDFVRKYNDSVKSHNEVVEKYNELVHQMEKLQAAQNK